MLEKISQLTMDQAKEHLLSMLENDLVHEKALKIQQYEQQLKDAFDKVVFVGDAHKGGTMADATLSAYENCWFF